MKLILLNCVLYFTLSVSLATAAVGLPPVLMNPEDIGNTPIFVIARLDSVGPAGDPTKEPNRYQYQITPMAQLRGSGSITRIVQQQSALAPLKLGSLYLFPVRRESAEYLMRDWLVPIPISNKTLSELKKPGEVSVASIVELLKGQLTEEDPAMVALTLLQLGSLRAEMPLKQIQAFYDSENTELALAAIYFGLEAGDGKALQAVLSEKSAILRERAPTDVTASWISLKTRTRFAVFHPIRLTGRCWQSRFDHMGLRFAKA